MMAEKILEKLDVLDKQEKTLLDQRAKVHKGKAKVWFNNYEVNVSNKNNFTF